MEINIKLSICLTVSVFLNNNLLQVVFIEENPDSLQLYDCRRDTVRYINVGLLVNSKFFSDTNELKLESVAQ